MGLRERLHTDGLPFFTGLHLPTSKPNDGQTFASVPGNRLLSLDEIKDIASDRSRTPRREFFDPKVWIRRQINSGCNGFSTAGALGRARVLRGLAPKVLSGDFIYSQMNGGRDAGSALNDGMRKVQEIGVCDDKLVRIGTYRANQISQEAYADAKNQRGFEAYRVGSELELASGVAQGWVGVVAVQVGRHWSQMDSRGVLVGDSGSGNHSVCCHDIRVSPEGRLEFEIPNSHGLSWGQDGHMWMFWARHFAQPSQYHDFWLLRSTIDGSIEEAPPTIKPVSILKR